MYKGAAFLHNIQYTRLCGGTLIDELHVLTALHCINGIPEEDLLVHFGDWNIYNYDEGEQVLSVSSFKRHPNQDVAIIELIKNVTINDCVEPARLYSDRPNVGRPLTVVGWGATEVNITSISEDLQELMVPVVESQVCITQ